MPGAATPTAEGGVLSSPTPGFAATLPPTVTNPPDSPTYTSTITSTVSPEPVMTLTETPTLQTAEPTASETPENQAIPTVDPNAAALQIYAPGPMSKVSSPIELRMYIAPRATGLTLVELYGEDGRLMARKVLRSVNYNGQFDKVIVELPFETNAAAELGRLQISTKDSHGRVQALKSVHVMLLSVGKSIITNEEYLRESVALVEPPLLHTISGGEVTVLGTMQVFNDLPVYIELIDERGESLGSRFISAGPADGMYHEINTSIPYKVTRYTPVRLVIRQSDDRIPGPFYLFSQEIFLSP
jgi:hypothetical protein